ncbi:hypothetical protein FHT09_003460 [Xanthomonas arboricola]|nr:hypothetical protein [Xanthomonas sp. CFBP 8152]
MHLDDKDAPVSGLILYRSDDAQTRVQVPKAIRAG